MSEAPEILTREDLNKIAAALCNGATVAQITNIGEDTLEGLYALGYDLYTSGNFSDAQTVFQALCMYSSYEYRFWMGLAGCRQGLGNLEGAIDAYQMAGIASGMQDPEPFFYASRCLIKLGRKEDAIGAIDGLLTIGDEANPAHAKCHAKARALLDLLKGKE